MSSITPAQAARQDHRDQGGRYSEYERSEPETNLTMHQDDITQRGSFYFPPRFTTAEDTIEFYDRVKIDDEIIARTVIASHQYRDAMVEQLEERKQESIGLRVKEHIDEWDRQPENRRKKKSPERAKVEQAEIDRLNELPYGDYGLDDAPEAINVLDGSEVVRAIKMCHYRPAPARFPEAAQKVDDHVVTLNSEDLTVRQIMDKYATEAVEEQLVYQPKQVEDRTGDLLQVVQELKGELAAVRQENQALLENDRVLSDNIGQVIREQHDAFTIQEAALGLRDSRGKWIGPGRRAVRKAFGRDD
ncbi:hypothetical protein GCM10009720_21070 [Yaniella flava]|uniref:Uncharacterized protein n=1 Tax=Yaniella flava TaxID=287930 RepID=A0ABN2UPJ3_9MICC